MKSLTTQTSPVMLAIAMALTSTTIYADSPREWGYWDAATAAGPNGGGSDGFSNMTASQNINTAQNNNSGDSLNNAQNITRLQRSAFETGQQQAGLTISEPLSEYVGYNYSPYGAPETAGKLYIDITKGEETNRSGLTLPPFIEISDVTYEAKLSANGSYSGSEYKLDNVDATLNESSVSAPGHNSKTSLVRVKVDGVDLPITLVSELNGVEAPFTSNSMPGGGLMHTGKPLSATSIATQLRLGQTYHFSGRSYYGSDVNIAINFQKASWKGNWSKSKLQNGFSATGGISSSTLKSNNVIGAGPTGIGFVTSGKVDASLVGAIKGADASRSAVIGKTIVNVQQAVGSKAVGDIFTAKPNR